MAESLVIFAIAAAGSLVRWSADFALRRFAIKDPRGTVDSVEIVSKGAWSGASVETADPVLRVGFILACYGALVLALVSAVPGAFALERTVFAFALLCAGGLVGEISAAGVTAQSPVPDDRHPGDAHRGGGRAVDGHAKVEPPRRSSRSLSLALALTLNFSIALLTAGQGLIPIVTFPEATDYPDRLEPVVVVARRSHDRLEEQTGSDRAGL